MSDKYRKNIHEALVECAGRGELDKVKSLLKQGAYVDAYKGRALRRAANNGHLEVVKCLIKHGADIHAHDDEAIKWAKRNNNHDVVAYISAAGKHFRIKKTYQYDTENIK